MFTVRLQTKVDGNYVTVKQVSLESFNETVAEKAAEVAEKGNLSLSLNIGHDDAVPAGYASKRLEFTTSIWKSKVVSAEEALENLLAPF